MEIQIQEQGLSRPFAFSIFRTQPPGNRVIIHSLLLDAAFRAAPCF